MPISDWREFYAALGTAAATFAGLLFVAVSINMEHLRVRDAGLGLRLAGRAFAALLLLVFFALTMLIPVLERYSLGSTLAAIAIQGIIRAVVEGARTPRGRRLSGVVLPILAYVGFGAAAGLTFAGSAWALPVLVAPVTLLLSSAANQSWRLLVLLESPGIKSTPASHKR